jgi:hypothetical protein
LVSLGLTIDLEDDDPGSRGGFHCHHAAIAVVLERVLDSVTLLTNERPRGETLVERDPEPRDFN